MLSTANGHAESARKGIIAHVSVGLRLRVVEFGRQVPASMGTKSESECPAICNCACGHCRDRWDRNIECNQCVSPERDILMYYESDQITARNADMRSSKQ